MSQEFQHAQLTDAMSMVGPHFKFDDGRGLILPAVATVDVSAANRGLLFRTEAATAGGDTLSVLLKLAGATTPTSQRIPVYGTDFMEIRNAVAKTLANDTNAQSPFTAANDTLTVEAATLYGFEMLLGTVQGTTSHTVAFTLAGTATYTNCAYYSEHVSVTDATLASNDVDHKWTKAATVTVITPAITATGSIIRLDGTFLVNAAGTVIPHITFSADPTGTCEAHIGSYFRLRRLPSAAIGPWA